MIGPSRRVYVFWLLLLLPTLAAGAGALVLLRNEQRRLDDDARLAAESRRAAIAARARLIAENVELLIGDVQAGLMSTLNEVPATNPAVFLDDWQRNNPLVQTTFQLASNGRITRPISGDSRAWLETWIAAEKPWSDATRNETQSETDPLVRKDISANVVQNQSLRSSMQEVARQGGLADQAKKNAAPSLPERSSWTAWRGVGVLHLVGWRQLASGSVMGVEVNLATVTARLGELLPHEGEFADAFAVRDAGGMTVQSKTYVAARLNVSSASNRTIADTPVVTIPVAASVLPGWEIVGFARDFENGRSVGGGFFLVGSLLVGIFVVAILSGGSLLLLQARRSEAEAAQKTSFVANVSHEFKTPLTTIRLYAELLEQGRVRDADQGNDYLRTIGRETQRLARLVNNALDFSRLEQGKKKYACEQVDLTAQLTRLLDTHAPRVAEAGLTLHRYLPVEPLVLKTDRDAFEQIVLNLLDNACKYAVEGGEIAVSLAARVSGGAEVHVADRGPGVPLEHRERIFEKFHRVDDALTTEKSGAGLGLSIARQLARGLGGELRYASRAGKGAEFVFELP
ncbi:MAG: HAMP domain-containing sensor histidine kinase [Opitutaceae bacterium]